MRVVRTVIMDRFVERGLGNSAVEQLSHLSQITMAYGQRIEFPCIPILEFELEKGSIPLAILSMEPFGQIGIEG